MTALTESGGPGPWGGPRGPGGLLKGGPEAPKREKKKGEKRKNKEKRKKKGERKKKRKEKKKEKGEKRS